MNNVPSAALACLQLIRLKGRVARDNLAASLAVDNDTAQSLVEALIEQELVVAVGTAVRITPTGRGTLTQWVAEERALVDQTALDAAYHRFDDINRAFKQLVADWQLRDGQSNDHSDAAYDGAIIDRLVQLDAGFAPLLAEIVALAPRLSRYPQRLASALEKLRAGDGSWLARPISDSYHTVWFELHEDLIGLLGLSRVEEAVAGRAE